METPPASTARATSPAFSDSKPSPKPTALEQREDEDDGQDALLQEHIVSPAATTERLQSIQRLVAEHTGEAASDFSSNVLKSIPVQVGGLYPITDVWYIEPALDDPDRLRAHIAQFAQEIASEAGLEGDLVCCDTGIGFTCAPDIRPTAVLVASSLPRAVLTLLHALSAPYQSTASTAAHIDVPQLANDLGPLLQGSGVSDMATQVPVSRLSDSALVKLFRLLRLARRLLDIEAGVTDGVSAMPGS